MGSVGKSSVNAEMQERFNKIKEGVATHSKEENDNADAFYKNAIAKEETYVNNLDTYIKLGRIKSAQDEWYQSHLNTYNSLKTQYKYFLKERKRQGR